MGIMGKSKIPAWLTRKANSNHDSAAATTTAPTPTTSPRPRSRPQSAKPPQQTTSSSIPKPMVVAKKDKPLPKRIPDDAMTLAAMQLSNPFLERRLIPHGPGPFNVKKAKSGDGKDQTSLKAVKPGPELQQTQQGPSIQREAKQERNIPNVQVEKKTSLRKSPEPRPLYKKRSQTAEKKTPTGSTSAIPDVKVHSLPDVSKLPGHAVGVPINMLENKLIKNIFSYLNPSDLKGCRQVQQHWNTLISQEDLLLENTVYVVNIDRSYCVATDQVTFDDVTSYATLPYLHCRFQYIDHHFLKKPEDFHFHNSDNENYSPSSAFFQSLTHIEFRNCFLLWKTIKCYLIQAVSATSLKISNCHISGFLPTSSASQMTKCEFDEFKAGNAIFGLTSLEIEEAVSLDSITTILRKFNGYNNESLKSLKISYHPSEHRHHDSGGETIAQARDFHKELKTIINSCKNSLTVLVLDIQHKRTLDVLGEQLTPELAQLGSKINLKEFQLSPPLDCWLSKSEFSPKTNVAMTMKGFAHNATESERKVMTAAANLGWFLESQENLETLGLPYLKHRESSAFFKSVLQGLPCAPKLKYLAVASASFLVDDLFHAFPSLKKVKIGDLDGMTYANEWNIFPQYTKLVPKLNCSTGSNEDTVICMESSGDTSADPKLEVTPDIKMISQVNSLTISCSTLPRNSVVVMLTMKHLTHLEVNSGFDIPIIRDGELQFFIKHLHLLRTLIISCADKLTDFGLTGIPSRNCTIMFHNQRYHKEGVNPLIWTSEKVTGRPLSDLKGLRKLVLIGHTKITDIGLSYGLAFKELKYCHLPYSDYITEWSVEQFSLRNPSLESLTFSGLNQFSKEAFNSVRKTHGRIKQGDTTRCSFFMERESPFTDNLFLGFPSGEDVYHAFKAYVVRPLTLGYYGSS